MFGDYELRDLLGRGLMGEVWRAHDRRTGRTVALRLLPPELAADPAVVQRFIVQLRIAAALNDPHVIPIHDFGQTDGRLFVDMRCIEGSDLRSILTAGPLPLDRAVSLVDQVASALRSAHRAGLVHRNVRPSNIMVTDDGFAYLAEVGLGLAEVSVAGAWPYLAPERFGDAEAGPASDVYSLACVLFECLTGTTPFPGATMKVLVAAHLSTPPPRPSLSRPGLPVAFDDVIARGMAKDAAQRYQSATDLAAAARAAVGAGLRPAPMAPVQRRRHRFRLVGILGATTAVALCAVIGLVVIRSDTGANGSADSPRAGEANPSPPTSHATTPTAYGQQIVLPFAALDGPRGLAVAANGDVLVADMNNVRVVRLAPATGIQTTLPITGLTQPVDVALDPAGNVYVADFTDPALIVRFQVDTATQTQVPLVEVNYPSSVAVDESGNAYVEGYQIADVVMVPAGTGAQHVVPFNAVAVGDFDVDAGGAIYAINISDDKVVRLDADWTTQTALPFSDIDPHAIAVGADGSVYVSDITNRAVSKWTPGTKSPVVLPITGLLRPTSIAVDAAGNVYVSDLDLNQVLELPVM